MADRKGFAFEVESKLLIPSDFSEACRFAELKAAEVLTLLDYFAALSDADYLSRGEFEGQFIDKLLDKGLLIVFESYLFPGTPKGRQQVERLLKGTLRIEDLRSYQYQDERPNVFVFYEDNIGPLTPHIAELIKLDLLDYPSDWLMDAMKEAAKNNARKYPYIQAILKNWKQYGRNKTDEKNQSSDKFKDLFRERHGR